MAGPLRSEKLSCWQGVDFSETRCFFSLPTNGSTDVQNLVPYDFTGCSARMNIRVAEDPASTSLLSLASGSGITFVAQTMVPGPPTPSVNNGVTIVITRTQSLAMNSGVPLLGAYYDLMIDTGGGTTLLLMAGSFDLLPTVTR